MEFNVLGIIICLRKFEFSVERLSVCYATEKLKEHGIYHLPRCNTHEVIDLLPQQLKVHTETHQNVSLPRYQAQQLIIP